MANRVWNSREESCRGNNWKNEEVIDLLSTIKKNNLMKGSPSGKQLGQLVEPLMGFTRTAFQITGKLKNLRMSYLCCKRRGSTHAARRKCPYYDLLSEIYSDKVMIVGGKATDDMLREAELAETEMMLYIAEKLDLSPSPRLRKISHNLLLDKTRTQIENGLDASSNQVKSMLKAQIKSFVESKESQTLNQNETLLLIPKTQLDYDSDQSDCWSLKETSVMLKIIEELGSAEAEKVSTISGAMNKKGYHRSSLEVQEKLGKMKHAFIRAKHTERTKDAPKGLPVCGIFKDIFSPDDNKDISGEGKKSNDKEAILFAGKTKHSRSHTWSDDETSLMLSLLQDLNLTHHIAQRLSFEVVREIVEPLHRLGYTRSPMQIQIKLRNLRKSYYKCLRAGCTKMAIAECPFFHKLNEIYEKFDVETKHPEDRKFDPIDPDHGDVSELLTDRGYYNSMPEEPSVGLPKFEKTSDVDSESSQMWMPVETICGEGSPVGVNIEGSGLGELDDAYESSSERKGRMGNYRGIEEANGSNDVEDSPEESITVSIDEHAREDTRKFFGQSKTNGEQKKAGSSQKSSNRLDSSKLRSTKHKLRKNLANRYSPSTKKDSSTLRTMRIVMAQLLRHEKLLQRQHHSWMERQFEIQRKHDRDHRELLIKELRELHKSFNSAMPKQQTANQPAC